MAVFGLGGNVFSSVNFNLSLKKERNYEKNRIHNLACAAIVVGECNQPTETENRSNLRLRLHNNPKVFLSINFNYQRLLKPDVAQSFIFIYGRLFT